MPAFMIITADIKDRDAFIDRYAGAAAALVERFGGRYVMRAGGAVVLEGAVAEGASVVVSEWQSQEAALAFWNSDEYAQLKLLRDGLADCSVLLVEAPALPG